MKVKLSSGVITGSKKVLDDIMNAFYVQASDFKEMGFPLASEDAKLNADAIYEALSQSSFK